MRFQALDSLRGVCALLVVLFHVEIVAGVQLGHLHGFGLIENGFHAVDFFFVLSGFVMAHSYMGRLNGSEDILAFLIRRFGRVYPLHLTVLVTLVAFELFRAWRSTHLGPAAAADLRIFTGFTAIEAIPANVLLVQALGLFPTPTWNTPSWSISVEFYTYCLFALFAFAMPRWRPASVLLAAVIAGGSAALVFMCSKFYMMTMADFGFFRCLYGFFAGALANAAFRRLSGRSSPSVIASSLLEAIAVAAAIAFIASTGEVAWSLASPVLFAGVVLVFARCCGWLTRCLRARPFQYLGDISYSVYISHFLVMTVFQFGLQVLAGHRLLDLTQDTIAGVHGEPRTILLLSSPWTTDAVVAAMIASCILLARALHHLIENPGRRKFARLAAPADAAARTAPHAVIPPVVGPDVADRAVG